MEYKPTQCISTGQNQGDMRFIIEQSGSPLLIVIGLNPSTANENQPDQTMKKVVRFAEISDYQGFAMINLYPQRHTYVSDLPSTPDNDVIKQNLLHIKELGRRYPNADVLVAYGNDCCIRDYLFSSLKDIVKNLETNNGRKYYVIGKLTKAGHPRHPLYAKYEWNLEPFDIKTYLDKMMF